MKLFGLLGYPVGHSASPAMMNEAFRTQQENAVYVPFGVAPEQLSTALVGLRALGASGVNVTIPHKRAAFEWVSGHTSEAELVGAVNTIRFDGMQAVGHNTDVSGWWRSVKDHVPQGDIAIVLLGAGGAAMAILAALATHRPQARIAIVARNPDAVSILKGRVSQDIQVEHKSWADRHIAVGHAQVVIQTTPIGMWPHANGSPIDDASVFSAGQVVQDIVYRPRETAFAKMALDQGATVVDGLSMLVYQGVDAYEWWLSREAPVTEMFDAAERHLRADGSAS